jgi:hypothetical protein
MRNPTRRSRNIGKTQGGRVKDGRATEKWSRLFPENKWRQITDSGISWQTFVENPSKAFYHPCSPSDYLAVLKRLPVYQTEDVKGIILRRTPKRDSRLGIDAWRRWSCIIMNAFPSSNRFTYSYKPKETQINFFKPFCDRWKEEKGVWSLEWDPDEVRLYYLYQVFLHEIGHINDWSKTSRTKRENYADTFARNMAEYLGER